MMCDCKKYGSTWACKLDHVDLYDLSILNWVECRKEDEEAAADFRLDQERDERAERGEA